MTEQILWPAAICNTSVQRVIETMYCATDDPSREGSRLFADCFTADGELVARGRICREREQLFNFRETAWDPITYRKHEIRKVYVSDFDKNDVVVIGRVVLRLRNGKGVEEGFGANFIVTEGGRIQKYQAWFDTKSLADLIAEAGL